MEKSLYNLERLYCPNIKSLSYCGSEGSDEEVFAFFGMYGHQL